MNKFYNINKEQYKTPQEVFDVISQSEKEPPIAFKIIATIGWGNIAVQINNLKEELPFFSEGLALSAFAISFLNNTANEKLPKYILEFGTECLKQLTEKIIDKNNNISEEQKNKEKEWWKLFLDIWKEWLKRYLEKEGLIS